MQFDIAGSRIEQTAGQTAQGGFSAAGFSHKAKALTRFQCQADSIDGPELAHLAKHSPGNIEYLDSIFNFQQRAHFFR